MSSRYRTSRFLCVANGFSLIELMVTLTVLLVLTMIAVPSMNDLLRDARLSSQTDSLVGALNSARSESVKRRINMTVCPAANPNVANACSGNAADWSNGFIVFDGAAVVQRIQAKGGITINSNGAASVVFSATTGTAVGFPATFLICSTGRNEQQVTVAISGHVSKQINATVCQ